MNKLHIYFVLALGLFSFSSQAQIKLNQLNAGVSYWERFYGGDDERAFMIGYPGAGEFSKGTLMPFLGAEVGVYKDLAVDLRVGLWSGKFENGARFGDGLVIEETIKQTIIPVSLGAVYRWYDLFGENLGASLGAGVNRYFLQNKVERVVYGDDASSVSETFSGNNYGGYFKAGLDYMFTARMGVGLDLRYNIGSYNQIYQIDSDDPGREYKIDLAGIEAGLSFIYRFSGSTE